MCILTLASLAPRRIAPSPVKPADGRAARRRGHWRHLCRCCGRCAAVADDAPAAAPPAEGEEAPAPVEFPKDWGITSDYYTDAAKVVAHMRLATSLEKGAPNMEMIALNCKKEMIDFVARGA